MPWRKQSSQLELIFRHTSGALIFQKICYEPHTILNTSVQSLSLSNSLQPRGLQHTRPPCPSPTPRVYSNSCPLSWWCHPTISSSVVLSPPAFSLSQHQGLFKWVSSLHQVAKVLEFELQHQSFQWIFRTSWIPGFPSGWTGWISLQSLAYVYSFILILAPSFGEL